MDSREFYNGILSHREKSDQWAEGAEHLVKLKKLASAHSSGLGSVLQDPSSWPLIVAGATAGGVIANSRVTPHKEYGGKSDPEARLGSLVERHKGEPEDGFFTKMKNRAVEHAHGIAKAFREHPNYGIGAGAVIGSILGLGVAKSLGAGGHTKVALATGGMGKALIGGGAALGGVVGLGTSNDHPLLGTAVGALTGAAALRGGSQIAQRAAGRLAGAGGKAVAPAAAHVAEGAAVPAASQMASKAMTPAGRSGAAQNIPLTHMQNPVKDVTPSSMLIPGQTPHPLAGQAPVIQDSAHAGILHGQGLIRKGVKPRLQDNYDIQQALKSGSPTERHEIIERIRGASPQDADALTGHYLRSPTALQHGPVAAPLVKSAVLKWIYLAKTAGILPVAAAKSAIGGGAAVAAKTNPGFSKAMSAAGATRPNLATGVTQPAMSATANPVAKTSVNALPGGAPRPGAGTISMSGADHAAMEARLPQSLQGKGFLQDVGAGGRTVPIDRRAAETLVGETNALHQAPATKINWGQYSRNNVSNMAPPAAPLTGPQTVPGKPMRKLASLHAVVRQKAIEHAIQQYGIDTEEGFVKVAFVMKNTLLALG